MSLSTLTFRRPRLIAIAILVIVSLGLSALSSLGRQEDPTIHSIYATVTTYFPGADPGRVEALVTTVIEDELRTLPEIEQVSSVSGTGVSIISLGLRDTVGDDEIEQVWSKMRDLLEDAEREFPAGVSKPKFEVLLGAYSVIVALTLDNPDTPTTILSRMAHDLTSILRGISGSERVTIYGAPDEEVLVAVDPRKAAELGLTVNDISRIVSAADSKVQAGQVRTSRSEMTINVVGEITVLDRVRRIIVHQGSEGHLVQLADIAEISRSRRTPDAEAAMINGKPGVLVAAKQADGLQIDVWMEEVRTLVDGFRASLPSTAEMTVVFDQSHYTFERLADVTRNMLIGAVLVVIVLFATLGLRAAIVVAIVLPLVTLATLATLRWLDIPIHQMSVSGLIVALGLLVDAAIVMTDDIMRRLRSGSSRETAVKESVGRLIAPLFASTLTTALAFLPMILLPGPVGDFLGPISIAVVAMVVWSFLVAIVVTPALAGWFLSAENMNGPYRKVPVISAFPSLFGKLVNLSIRNPLQSAMLALTFPLIGFLSLPSLKAQFFPAVDRDQFYIEVELQPGTTINETLRTVRAVDADLRQVPEIEMTVWTVGRSAPPFYYNMMPMRQGTPEYAQALVKTTSPEVTKAVLKSLQPRYADMFPGARIIVRGLVQGPPVDAPVELRLTGPDLAVLKKLGDEARRVLSAMNGVIAVRTSSDSGAARVDLHIDEAMTRQLNLDLSGVARQLEASFDGVIGGSMIEGLEQINVRVRMGTAEGGTSGLWNAYVVPPGGGPEASAGRFGGVPLLSLGEPQLVPAESVIARRNGERVNRVSAFLVPDLLPEEVTRRALNTLQSNGFALPTGYRMQIGGDADARRITLDNLKKSFMVVLTFAAATIVLSLNSFRLAGIVIVIAILSVGLSMLALEIFNYPFGINAVIGVIGSVGVAVNAALIILSSLRDDRLAAAGDREAIARVVLASSRHIVSTTVTTIGGFLPLILSGGDFWPPFAVAIAGGVALSTIMSFFFVPPMFTMLVAGRSSIGLKPERNQA